MMLRNSTSPKERPKPLVVGLVGGIASGKSTVAKILGYCGAAVIDADRLGHESYQPGTACYKKLISEFGEDIVAADGTIDRKALGTKVFASEAARQRLQGAVWPEIRKLAEERIAEQRERGTDSVVLEAAVMLEAGWDDITDEIWAVAVEPDVARVRLMARNGLTPEQADARIAAQMSNAERAARVDAVVANDGDLPALERRVRDLWEKRDEIAKRKKEGTPSASEPAGGNGYGFRRKASGGNAAKAAEVLRRAVVPVALASVAAALLIAARRLPR